MVQPPLPVWGPGGTLNSLTFLHVRRCLPPGSLGPGPCAWWPALSQKAPGVPGLPGGCLPLPASMSSCARGQDKPLVYGTWGVHATKTEAEAWAPLRAFVSAEGHATWRGGSDTRAGAGGPSTASVGSFLNHLPWGGPSKLTAHWGALGSVFAECLGSFPFR